MFLRDLLKEKSTSHYQRLDGLEQKARDLLPRICGTFPEYTDHSWSHSQAVEDNLNWLLTDTAKRNMNSTELFCLLVAAWFHDIGMIGEIGDERDEERKGEIRKTHNVRSRSFIINNRIELGLSEIEAATIGDICMAHRTIDISKELPTNRVVGQDQVRVQFLGACLRLADGCHMTYDRASELVAKVIKPTGESKFHFDRHASVGGVGIDESGAVIEITGIAASKDGEKILSELEKEIKHELKDLRHILAPNDVPAKAVNLAIIRLGDVPEEVPTVGTKPENVPVVLITNGPDKGKEYSIDKEMTGIGRGNDNDIIIDKEDIRASRKHAVLYVENGECFLEDTGSMNGTRLGGKSLDKNTRVKLKDRDEIQIGNMLLCFRSRYRRDEQATKR